MKNRKIKLIPALPLSAKTKKVREANTAKGLSVTPENLRAAYTQMFQLKSMIENDVPLLLTDIQKKDDEIKKLKIMHKLKDESKDEKIRKLTSDIEMKDKQLSAQRTRKRLLNFNAFK